MSGILVVERSATLSHLLRRTLAAASLAPRSELASFLDTVRRTLEDRDWELER